MKNSTIAAVAAMAALGFGASAQHTAPAVQPEPAPAPAGRAAKPQELMQQLLDCVDEQIAVLKSATDRHSADVAGAKLEKLLHDQAAAMEALDRLRYMFTEEERAAFEARLLPLYGEFSRLENLPQAFYGSTYLEAGVYLWDGESALFRGMDLSEEFLGKLMQAANLLAGVKDCAGADAAAGQVETLLTEAVALDELMDKLIPYEQRCTIKQMTGKEFRETAVLLLKAVQPLEQQPRCYGSAKLQAALESLPVFDFSEGVQEK